MVCWLQWILGDSKVSVNFIYLFVFLEDTMLANAETKKLLFSFWLKSWESLGPKQRRGQGCGLVYITRRCFMLKQLNTGSPSVRHKIPAVRTTQSASIPCVMTKGCGIRGWCKLWNEISDTNREFTHPWLPQFCRPLTYNLGRGLVGRLFQFKLNYFNLNRLKQWHYITESCSGLTSSPPSDWMHCKN